jgi:hypothetical protein
MFKGVSVNMNLAVLDVLLASSLFSSRGNVDKKEALENLDLVLLCIDEIIDGGYVIGYS